MLYKKNSEKVLSDNLFKNPTSEYRATPFWAWNCKMTEEILTSQIPLLKEMGFGGFHMHSRTGMANEYLSEEFMNLIDKCVEKAKDENMLAWLYDEDRWPSGAAGGYVTKEKKYRQRHMYFSKTKPEGAVDDLNTAIENDVPYMLAAYDVLLNDDGELASYRRISPDDNAENKWYAYLEADKSDPWYNNYTYVDTMNSEAIDKFIEITHETYKKKCPDEFGKAIPAIFTDEPNYGRKKGLKFSDSTDDCMMPWTINLDKGFKSKYGFDIVDKLPEIFWNLSGGKISQARYCYHDHITELFTEAFCDNIGKWCIDNGIYLTGHVLNEPSLGTQSNCVGEAMRTYRGFGIPGIDMLCNHTEYSTAKQCQSAVHQYGREGMLSELYGVTGWEYDFRGHKFQGDWQAALGVTVRVPHLAWVSMEGRAKRDYPACIGYQSPWYKEYKYIEDHFARVNTALTRGKPVVKIGVIHPIESYWINYGPNQSTASVRKRLDDQFLTLIEYLLFNTIDFDFICESLLPDQCGNIGKSLEVGVMEYDTVIVPDCITLRGTTVDILEKFKQAGGKIIFIGSCPTHVDAIENDRVKKLFDSSVKLSFSESDIIDALADNRTVSIKNSDGTNTSNLIYNMRRDNDCLWLFIAHGKDEDSGYATCEDVCHPQDTVIGVKGCYKPIIYNTLDGTISNAEYSISGGWTKIPYTFFRNDSLLLKLTETNEKSYTAEKEQPKEVKETIYVNKATYLRDEPNVLLLDTCEFAIDDGEFEPEEEILRLDNICRERLSLPQRRVSSAQPWVVSQEPPTHSVTMRFRINSDIELDGALLAIERPFEMKAEFNGEKLSLKEVGYFTDKFIKTVELPKIHKGENILTVTAPFAERKNLEWLYVLGDFNVELCGCEKTIVSPTDKIGFGSITSQGMPFYGGSIIYKSEFETSQPGDAYIRVNGYRGPVMRVYVDGKDLGLIAFAPYNVVAENLKAGKHTVEIKLYGNRCNSFNSLHNSNSANNWCGEDRWYTEGDSWSYEYNLKDFGIIFGPVIEIK